MGTAGAGFWITGSAVWSKFNINLRDIEPLGEMMLNRCFVPGSLGLTISLIAREAPSPASHCKLQCSFCILRLRKVPPDIPVTPRNSGELQKRTNASPRQILPPTQIFYQVCLSKQSSAVYLRHYPSPDNNVPQHPGLEAERLRRRRPGRHLRQRTTHTTLVGQGQGNGSVSGVGKAPRRGIGSVCRE